MRIWVRGFRSPELLNARMVEIQRLELLVYQTNCVAEEYRKKAVPRGVPGQEGDPQELSRLNAWIEESTAMNLQIAKERDRHVLLLEQTIEDLKAQKKEGATQLSHWKNQTHQENQARQVAVQAYESLKQQMLADQKVHCQSLAEKLQQIESLQLGLDDLQTLQSLQEAKVEEADLLVAQKDEALAEAAKHVDTLKLQMDSLKDNLNISQASELEVRKEIDGLRETNRELEAENLKLGELKKMERENKDLREAVTSLDEEVHRLRKIQDEKAAIITVDAESQTHPQERLIRLEQENSRLLEISNNLRAQVKSQPTANLGMEIAGSRLLPRRTSMSSGFPVAPPKKKVPETRLRERREQLKGLVTNFNDLKGKP